MLASGWGRDEAEDGLIHFKIEYSSLEYHHILYGGAIERSKEEGLFIIMTEFLRGTHLSVGHDLKAALHVTAMLPSRDIGSY